MPCCSICKREDDNPVDYGEFLTKSDIVVHYYCVLLSTHLPQKGTDSSGILGFLVRDIRNEIAKSKTRICCYCQKPNATLVCFECKQCFHNICGNQNNCVSEFTNDFRSYCHNHVPFRNEEFLTNSKSTCWICEEPLGDFSPVHTLRAYCCQNGYVHRYCMRKYALSAGYRLICIWCTNKDFREDIRKRGVFVPDREAIWDNNETLRYTDLHRGYSHCDAKVCHCPQGREYFRNRWKLVVCCLCGSSGVHDRCAELINKKYTCETCNQIQLQRDKYQNRSTNPKMSACISMFISKTYNETPDVLPVFSCAPEEQRKHLEDVASTPLSNKNKNQRKEVEIEEDIPIVDLASSSCTLNSNKETKIVEMFLLAGKNSDIIGTVKVNHDKVIEKENRFLCDEEDILEFSTSNKLIEDIFSEIEAEGRVLSVDMVDEVFDRWSLRVETSSVDVDSISKVLL